ncbi:hypothetical protein LJC15_03960 [Desulfovibrio sp. OttesenSCG-928-G11]|nr:hypothetical protein [Desulfovibrio sp. OttesenSCG-928-G11]
MTKLYDYLDESYSLSNFKAEITRLAQALALKTGNPKKQILLNGLIGVMLGAYCLNNKKVMELTKEFVSSYIKLL